MKSRKDPANDCENALLELVLLHWVERMTVTEGKEKTGEVLLGDDEENEYEAWGPISHVELGSSADILGFDCSTFMKKYFKNQDLDIHVDLDSRNIVELGCRLWDPDQTVFGCSMNHKEGNRTSFFVKLCIKVNIDRQNGPRATMKELTYFDEVVSFLRYTFPDGSSRLLALVKVFDVKTNKDCI